MRTSVKRKDSEDPFLLAGHTPRFDAFRVLFRHSRILHV